MYNNNNIINSHNLIHNHNHSSLLSNEIQQIIRKYSTKLSDNNNNNSSNNLNDTTNVNNSLHSLYSLKSINNNNNSTYNENNKQTKELVTFRNIPDASNKFIFVDQIKEKEQRESKDNAIYGNFAFNKSYMPNSNTIISNNEIKYQIPDALPVISRIFDSQETHQSTVKFNNYPQYDYQKYASSQNINNHNNNNINMNKFNTHNQKQQIIFKNYQISHKKESNLVGYEQRMLYLKRQNYQNNILMADNSHQNGYFVERNLPPLIYNKDIYGNNTYNTAQTGNISNINRLNEYNIPSNLPSITNANPNSKKSPFSLTQPSSLHNIIPSPSITPPLSPLMTPPLTLKPLPLAAKNPQGFIPLHKTKQQQQSDIQISSSYNFYHTIEQERQTEFQQRNNKFSNSPLQNNNGMVNVVMKNISKEQFLNKSNKSRTNNKGNKMNTNTSINVEKYLNNINNNTCRLFNHNQVLYDIDINQEKNKKYVNNNNINKGNFFLC